MKPNPFTPSFSKTPEVLAGRASEMELFQSALDNPLSPYRASLLVGPRGSGKSTLLGEFRDMARKQGWVAIKLAAGTTMAVHDLERSTLPRLLYELDYQGPQDTRISGVGVLDGSVSTEVSSPYTLSIEMALQEACKILADSDHQTGLLVTIDELHKITAEMGNVLTSIASVWEDGYPIAFVGATLPASLDLLLGSDDRRAIPANPMTFLRRAKQMKISIIPKDEVKASLREGILRHGKKIDAEVLDFLAQRTGGYAFMIQSLGYHAWNESTSDYISRNDVEAALRSAQQDMVQNVFGPAVNDCSKLDLQVLTAIAENGGTATREQLINEVERINANSYGMYRKRLIESGLVVAPRRGQLRLALPGFKDYLIELSKGEDAWDTYPDEYGY
jgi:hypothetical protein